ncbi:hypothetical protein ACW6GR_000405 [Klebsiella michiganensis]
MKYKTRIAMIDAQDYNTIMVEAHVNEWDYIRNVGDYIYEFNGKKFTAEDIGLNELRLFFDYEYDIWTTQWLCLEGTSSRTVKHTDIPYISGLTEEEQFQLSTIWGYEVKMEHVQFFQDYALARFDQLQGTDALVNYEELDFNVLDSWM